MLSPAGWLDFLAPRLDAQAAADQFYRDYHAGLHKLAYATAKFKQAFSQFFSPMAYNWMELVVDAAVERLEVQGFRFDVDPDKPDWDQQSDRDAWAIWQANGLDAQSVIAHTEAVKCGKSYLMVAPPAAEGEEPRITVESGLQVYVQTAQGDPRNRLAALKRFQGEDGYLYSTLYLPGRIEKFRSVDKPAGSNRVQWKRRPDDPGGRNPLDVVPIIPLENNPDIVDGGRSDLQAAVPYQDSINKLCLDMMVSSAYHADPQLTATGWEVPRNEDGTINRQAALAVGQGTILAAEDPAAKFGQLLPGDVDNYLKPIDALLDQVAAVTRTPAYYIKGKMANMSAEALQAAETGLVRRCKRKQLSFGESWEEAMRLAFKAKGDDARAGALAAETVWADSESRSLAQVVDAAVKLRTSLDVPAEVAWQIAGFSPQQIQQMIVMNNWTPGGPATKNPDTNGAGEPSRVVLPAGTRSTED